MKSDHPGASRVQHEAADGRVMSVGNMGDKKSPANSSSMADSSAMHGLYLPGSCRSLTASAPVQIFLGWWSPPGSSTRSTLLSS